MGSSHSTPPPLVQVSAPRGKVLVPPGTAFTVHPPPPYPRSRSDPYTRGTAGPVFTPYTRGRTRARRGWNNARYGHGGEGADIEIAEEISGDSETTTAETMMEDEVRRRRRKAQGNPVGMDVMGLNTLDSRPRSAPEMFGLGGYTDMPTNMSANGVTGMQQLASMPPEYTSNPNLAGYGGGGTIAGAGMLDTCSSYRGPRPSPPSSNDRPSPQPVPRGRPNHYEHVPMGAYTDAKRARKSPGPHADQPTSTRRNYGQEPMRKVGLRSHGWLDGDAFLDACTCTTGCRCRKGQRVLYRARDSRQRVGSESEGEQDEYTSGEIRYILKDDLGRDCGDHTRCRKSEGSGGEDNQSQKRKEKKEGKKLLQQQLQSFKDEILEALDERFDDMRWERRQSGKVRSPAQPSLGASGLGQGVYTVNGGPPLEARVARQTGVRNYNGHGVVRPDLGSMPHGVSGLAGAGMRGHGLDIPDLDDGGHDSDKMEKRHAMEPNSTSRYGTRAGPGPAMCSQPPGGRGAAIQRHSSRGRRGSQGEYESGEMDAGPEEGWMRTKAGQRAGRERASRRGGGRLGRREPDVASGRQARADTDEEAGY